jgi:hypothetical protein
MGRCSSLVRVFRFGSFWQLPFFLQVQRWWRSLFSPIIIFYRVDSKWASAAMPRKLYIEKKKSKRSILAKHCLDYSPEKLKEIYDKADLKVLV